MQGAAVGRAVEARLVIRHWGCIVAECLRDGAQATHVSSDHSADVVAMHGRDEAQVETFIANVRATQVNAPEIVLRGPNTVVLRIRTPENGVFSAILRAGCSVLWPALWHDGLEKYTVLAPTRRHLDAAIEGLSRIATVRVDEASSVAPGTLGANASVAGLTAGLTDRQLRAFVLAVERGYYESPRATGTDALAAEMGVARTTFEEHLRKAEARVLPRLSAVIAAHPVLKDAANRRPGRPSRRERELAAMAQPEPNGAPTRRASRSS